jgi:hypothetical protein
MKLKLTIVIAAITAIFAMPVLASHNRGSVLIPSIDANGNLTIDATSFWRTNNVDDVNSVTITGPVGGSFTLSMGADTLDTSDTRYTRVDESASTNISNLGAGLYTISWGSCCRVSGIPNAGGNMGTTSTILWDGQTATNPITFDIQNIQPEVVRGSAYSDNLGVTSANSDTLSYDDTVLTVGFSSQATGYSLSNTGQINIDAASTATYADNASNIGADMAFSGEITARDGSGATTATVQFDWLFDGVAQGANQAPDVIDVIVNASVGDMINTNIMGTDPQMGDLVTLSFVSFTGPGGAIGGSMFTPGMAANPTSGNFVWDSTGFAAGQYVAIISGTDGSLTDQGTITINLTSGPTGPSPVPLPAGVYLLGAALAGLGAIGRRRRRK